nr:MAG TPA: hypothetical protein [Caudoviricetes sp.]
MHHRRPDLQTFLHRPFTSRNIRDYDFVVMVFSYSKLSRLSRSVMILEFF